MTHAGAGRICLDRARCAAYGLPIAGNEIAVDNAVVRRRALQFKIEARQLTSESIRRNPADARLTTIEATDVGEAISSFVRESASELVSLQTFRGRESIATVRKDDSVFLVRCYEG